MSCDPERVTAYVDGLLEGPALASVEAHLAGCPVCAGQAAAELELRARLKSLPAPEPRPGFEDELRRRIRSSRRRRGLWLLPLAAGLTALALLGRGSPALVAWEVSRDHTHCFGQKQLPAQVRSSDPAIVGAWFERQGTAELEKAGFYGLAVLKQQFWKEIEGYNFYSLTVRGYKFHKTAGCVFLGHRAIYLGPYASVMDEEGHLFARGQALEVCTDTLAKLSHDPYQGSFHLLAPGVAAPESVAVSCGPGCC